MSPARRWRLERRGWPLLGSAFMVTVVAVTGLLGGGSVS